MGLGKTLQTLAWLAWLRERGGRNPKPALVVCPASVLHNWRREAEKFTRISKSSCSKAAPPGTISASRSRNTT